MPTVLRLFGFRVVIYTNDHEPAHVHVIGNDTEALFYLNCPDGPVTIRENYGVPERDLTWLKRELLSHVSRLCKKWEALHDRA